MFGYVKMTLVLLLLNWCCSFAAFLALAEEEKKTKNNLT